MPEYANNFERYSDVESMLVFDRSVCQNPDLSIMIPTFKRPKLLMDSIASVINLTGHNFNIELVIVDNDPDGSDEELIQLVSEFLPFNIRVYRNATNIGMFGNWNRCIELARATKLSILNDDDILHPLFIKYTYQPGCKEMRVVSHVTFSDAREVDWNEDIGVVNFKRIEIGDLVTCNPAAGSLGVIMDKQCAITLGGYNPNLWPTSDYYFTYLYMMEYGLFQTRARLSGYRWLVNESLKNEALSGFLKNDFSFRNTVFGAMPCSKVKKSLMCSISRFMAVSSAIVYENINSDFDAVKNLNENNIFVSGFTLSLFRNKRFLELFRSKLSPLLTKAVVRFFP